MKHELKCWSSSFLALVSGAKTFEIRREDDRTFSVGDTLFLREFKPCFKCNGTGRHWDNGDTTDCGMCKADHGEYLGATISFDITYIARDAWGLTQGVVVLGLKRVEEGLAPEELIGAGLIKVSVTAQDETRACTRVEDSVRSYLQLHKIEVTPDKLEGIQNEISELLSRLLYNFT